MVRLSVQGSFSFELNGLWDPREIGNLIGFAYIPSQEHSEMKLQATKLHCSSRYRVWNNFLSQGMYPAWESLKALRMHNKEDRIPLKLYSDAGLLLHFKNIRNLDLFDKTGIVRHCGWNIGLFMGSTHIILGLPSLSSWEVLLEYGLMISATGVIFPSVSASLCVTPSRSLYPCKITHGKQDIKYHCH